MCMMRITKSSANDVVLTLSELATSPSADYLFVLTHDLSGEEKIFAAPLVETNGRFDRFVITDTPTEDPLSGEVDLREGFHAYVVHQVPRTSPPTLDPADSQGVVEVGKVLVTGTSAGRTVYDEDYKKDIPAYNG